MRINRILLVATFCSALVVNPVLAQKTVEVDVCVYGGTSAGVIAAYTVQKLGKKAVLIEPGKNLGGMSSGGLGYTDIGNKYAITGLARDFYRRIGKHYGKFEQWIFEPKVAEALFNDYVKRGGYQVLYTTRVKEVKKDGKRITEVTFENADRPDRSTDIIVKAKMFIDCGYEGDLMAKAGVSYTVGREANKDYNETINGVQLMHGHQFPDGIDPYKIPGKPESGLLWGISKETLPPNGTGDKKVQAYNYRICLSSDPQNQVTITRPEAYDSTRYELLLRLFDAFPQKRTLNDYMILSHMPNKKTDINNRGGFSTDMIGMNYGYPDGTYDQRRQIIRDHELYTKGLLYFYGHDPRVPQQLRDEMLRWGYPKDEYVNNGNWSPQLYVREARRMIGSYVMTQANCESKEVVKDGVGMAAYTMDSHNIQRLVVNGQVKNEGNVEVGGFGPYPIAYGSLVPKASEVTNMLVPVCLSATHIAYGSIRMEPVFMVLAQSSATAAVMAIDAKTDVQRIDVARLQQRLKTDPLSDGKVFDILVDNDDAQQVQVKGNWTAEKRGGYGPSFLVSQAGDASVRFTPEVPKKGKYTAYIYFPKTQGSASSTTVTVHDGKQSKEVVIKESDVRVEGQTSGEWVSLGTYELPQGKKGFAEVSAKNADGKVIADAVIWVPAQ
ncbi:FAD-dependent oxidoreductase [Fulvivirgaceae bacterium PWU4]|uniref:FAD-dependent oxidoreductase n=1 Tax=Chryseosolibacter histidini TaxID=2782349 RepID=A0AAP2DQI1_9BACT|nr:FAD-dependent oxidoreductase [Chryseosolibacter histidini]MBT1699147.1 FAD-dependent oxidoreductase [Chryseosolibacter histidini]